METGPAAKQDQGEDDQTRAKMTSLKIIYIYVYKRSKIASSTSDQRSHHQHHSKISDQRSHHQQAIKDRITNIISDQISASTNILQK